MEGFFSGGSNGTELDGEMGDSHMGVQARLMSQAMRKLTGTVSKSTTCLIFINQIRRRLA
jgi:recombination protein RecA